MEKTWYYVFGESAGNLPAYQRWLIKGAPKKFQHVAAFCQQGPAIQRVEPLPDRIDIAMEWMPGEIIDAEYYAHVWAEKDVVIVRHKFKPRLRGWKAFFNLVPSCVTVTKVATGFYSSARTPFQLYKHLVESGGVIINPEVKDGFYEAEGARSYS